MGGIAGGAGGVRGQEDRRTLRAEPRWELSAAGVAGFEEPQRCSCIRRADAVGERLAAQAEPWVRAPESAAQEPLIGVAAGTTW